MTLAVKAKEQYLIGNYPAALDTFRDVQGQIQRHIQALEQELSHGDPATLAEVERAYEEWNRCVELLQEEFGMVQQIQAAGLAFKVPPGAQASGGQGLHTSSASSSVGGLGLSDAQLQAQHLAQQQATDIRDPDVWPPPTPQDPSAAASSAPYSRPAANKRQSSVGGNSSSNAQWGAASGASSAAASAAARPAPSMRTPMKPPQSAADDDAASASASGSGPLSNRLPSWASGGAGAAAGGAKAAPISVNKPRVSRTPFESAPRANPVAASSAAAAAAASSAAAASAAAAAASSAAKVPKERKPPIPTGGRKTTLKAAGGAAKKAGSGNGSSKDDSVAAPATNEDGTPARVKFEAASKDEQEMADMIEREILDKTPNVKMEDIAGLTGVRTTNNNNNNTS